jgi:hypothetical protein
MAEATQIERGAAYQADPHGEPAIPLTVDHLEYMADLMSELREMSHRSGLETLAAILALAETEAGQQIAARRHS